VLRPEGLFSKNTKAEGKFLIFWTVPSGVLATDRIFGKQQFVHYFLRAALVK